MVLKKTRLFLFLLFRPEFAEIMVGFGLTCLDFITHADVLRTEKGSKYFVSQTVLSCLMTLTF